MQEMGCRMLVVRAAGSAGYGVWDIGGERTRGMQNTGCGIEGTLDTLVQEQHLGCGVEGYGRCGSGTGTACGA